MCIPGDVEAVGVKTVGVLVGTAVGVAKEVEVGGGDVVNSPVTVSPI